MLEFFVCLLSFFIGSIPFGVIFSLWLCNKNPQDHGSKNIGMTNVWRIGGPKTALPTFLCDVGKGIFVMWLAQELQIPVGCCAFLVVFGHCYSAFLGFTGGKGLATSSGIIFFLSPTFFFILFTCWLLTRQITHSSTKSAIVALVLLPLLGCFFIPDDLFTIILLSLLVTYRHTENFQRLKNNRELTL
jgi:acyl phosphate:glycerol-3-phosphate acyltransferase